MTSLNGKTILISQLRLHDYAGSEIVTLELAEELCEQGASVFITTDYFGLPISKEFDNIKNLKVLKMNDPIIDKLVDDQLIDYAWIHHQSIPPALIKNPGKIRFIFHHMSPYSLLEQPFFYKIENALADIILYNSDETYEKIKKDRYLSELSGEFHFTFNNPAPDIFSKKSIKKESMYVSSVLVVSNHIPTELSEAIKILQGRGVTVVTFGSEVNRYRRVLPGDISDSDVVISIGKTVQYALLSGRPVYCYDRFGGPGYLTSKNFEKTARLNFSGRGFDTKTPNEIADAILSEYSDALNFTSNLSQRHKDDYTLSKQLTKVMEKADKNYKKRVKPAINSRDASAFMGIREIISSYLPKSVHDLSKNRAYKDKITELTTGLQKLEKEIHTLRHSRLYRVLDLVRRLKAKVFKKRDLIRDDCVDENYGKSFDSKHVGFIREVYPQFKSKRQRVKVAVISSGIGSQPTSSFFIRVLGPLTYKKNSHRIQTTLYPQNTVKIESSDVCIVQRTAFDDDNAAKELIRFLREAKTKLILESDDVFEKMDKSHIEYDKYKDKIEAYKIIMAGADRLWVSSGEIGHSYRGKRLIIPNSLDTRLWNLHTHYNRRHNKFDTLKLIYMGTSTHSGDFELILDDLDELHRSYPGRFNLSIVGISKDLPERDWINKMEVPRLYGIYPRFVKWFQSLEGYHIGLAPLVKDKFNLAKSDIKILDYLGNNVLPVVSDIKPYQTKELKKMVIKVGYSHGAWKEVLENYILNPSELHLAQKSLVGNRIRYLGKKRSMNRVANFMRSDLLRLTNNTKSTKGVRNA